MLSLIIHCTHFALFHLLSDASHISERNASQSKLQQWTPSISGQRLPESRPCQNQAFVWRADDVSQIARLRLLCAEKWDSLSRSGARPCLFTKWPLFSRRTLVTLTRDESFTPHLRVTLASPFQLPLRYPSPLRHPSVISSCSIRQCAVLFITVPSFTPCRRRQWSSMPPLNRSCYTSSASVVPPATLPPPTAPAAKKGGRKSGSTNWTPHQVDLLLDQVRAVLPRGHQEWEKVVLNYNQLTGESADYDRLHGKFIKLARTVKPTGKHTKPTDVHRAQPIIRDIEARVEAGLGDGEDGDEDAIDGAAMQQLSLAPAAAAPASARASAPAPAPAPAPARAPASRSPSPPTSSSSSSSSSPRPGSRPHLRSFPSDRQQSKKSRPGSDVIEALHVLGTSMVTAINAQMEQSREETKLAREQMAVQQQQMTQQMALQQQQMMGERG